tara:strand:- start:1906 stop:2232 length:327 start_codon:yes stop_codon:yes gene_type:complete
MNNDNILYKNDIKDVNNIINLTYNTINKIDVVLDKIDNILDILFSEWLEYDLLKKTNKTLDLYYNIGVKIYDNIELIIIILPISIFIIFCFQIIICIYFIYNNKEFKD